MYFLQSERKITDIVETDSIVDFDTLLTVSETSGVEDFFCRVGGTIDVLRPGVFFVHWNIVSMAGLADNGHIFELKKFDFDDTLTWVSVAGAASHFKTSVVPGFCIFEVTQDELDTYGRAAIAIFNISAGDVSLTSVDYAKAGLLIFGLGSNDLEYKLSLIEKQIVNIYEEIHEIKNFINLSDVTYIWSTMTQLRGLGAGVIHSGYTYNFWGIGALDHVQTLNNSTVYMLITSDQCPELKWYHGESIIGTLWIETPTGNVSSMPIRFDDIGIYFTPTSNMSNLPIGTTFKFTQALILVPPQAP